MGTSIEIWKWVLGHRNRYKVSSLGRVKSVSRYRTGKSNKPVKVNPRYLKYSISKTGYCMVSLCKDGSQDQWGVHQLVAQSFLPNPQNKPEVNHKDGNKLNNRLTNLEWSTRKENADHASRHGLLRGNQYPKKLTKTKVLKIRKLLKNKIKRILIAEKFGVTFHTIADIAINRTWKHI